MQALASPNKFRLSVRSAPFRSFQLFSPWVVSQCWSNFLSTGLPFHSKLRFVYAGAILPAKMWEFLKFSKYPETSSEEEGLLSEKLGTLSSPSISCCSHCRHSSPACSLLRSNGYWWPHYQLFYLQHLYDGCQSSIQRFYFTVRDHVS